MRLPRWTVILVPALVLAMSASCSAQKVAGWTAFGGSSYKAENCWGYYWQNGFASAKTGNVGMYLGAYNNGGAAAKATFWVDWRATYTGTARFAANWLVSGDDHVEAGNVPPCQARVVSQMAIGVQPSGEQTIGVFASSIAMWNRKDYNHNYSGTRKTVWVSKRVTKNTVYRIQTVLYGGGWAAGGVPYVNVAEFEINYGADLSSIEVWR